MNLGRLKAQDIKVFVEAAGAFFEQTTRRKARVRTAYMLERPQPVVWDDFQGLIELGGAWRGTVGFSAPRGLLSHLLLVMGERDYSDASHRDVVGEIANQMSGYARRHFGEGMDIAPPRVLSRGSADESALQAIAFAIPMSWDRYEAHLVVAMAPAKG